MKKKLIDNALLFIIALIIVGYLSPIAGLLMVPIGLVNLFDSIKEINHQHLYQAP